MDTIKNYILMPLIIIGALNWGLVGLFNFDLVVTLFGMGTLITKVVYSLVGIAGFVYLFTMMNKI
ncbi:MAG: DUF378 domain-containing protein, partial [Alphaproteobacteria bacterium]|nr:DUF378 domain-containing protein [Alphaproteobacteria bacterium]